MKAILGFLAFLFFLFVLVILLTGSYIVNVFRKMRKAAMDAAEQQANQYHRETGRQRQQYSQRHRNSANSQSRQSQEESETIIDYRRQERENQKIFDDSDGEYVDFVEMKNEE